MRPLFHTKNEALSGVGTHRLHVACGESLCSQTANVVRFGSTALVLWLLMRGFWLALIIYLIVATALALAGQMLGLDEEIQFLIMFGLHVLVGFEADTIERWTLRRHGWDMIGTVAGRDVVECERRFFDAWLPDQPMLRPETLSVSQITGSGDASISLGGVRRDSGRSGGWRSAFSFGARR